MSDNFVRGVKETILPDKDLKTLFLLHAAWLALMLAGIPAQGFARLDAAWAAGLAADLVLAAGILFSVKAYLLGDRAKGYRGYKAFLGYGVFFTYVAQAIAPYSWRETLVGGAPLISGPRALFGWLWALVATAPALALYIMVSTNAWRVKLGVLTKKDLAAKVRYKTPKPKTVAGKALDNVDAVVQAVIMVACIHAVLFQLYVIPTESMVPKFLVNDRVIVTKAQSGPRIPLSPVKLPSLTAPKRGDIIVYDNPFSPKPDALRRMVNTVAFYLSFSFLNLDVDAAGRPRVGTVVKRLVGMPGEKLMMVDDTVYVKTKASPDWQPLEADKSWARTDLYKEKPATLKKIQQVVMREEYRREFDAVDKLKADRSLARFDEDLALARAPFLSLSSAKALAGLSEEGRSYLKDSERSSWGPFDAEARADGIASLYRAHALAMNYDVGLFLFTVSDQSRLDAFKAYLGAPPRSGPMNAYQESAAKLNDYAKALQARRWAAYLDLMKAGDFRGLSRISSSQNGSTSSSFADFLDGLAKQGGAFREWGVLLYYMEFYDMRNFPEFPAGDEYIPARRYFLMGDNRYNSLDFRYYHDDQVDTVPLDPSDPLSATRQSRISMSSLSEDNILGKVLLTFWPPGSAGR